MVEEKKKEFFYGYLVVAACCAICFAPVTLSFNTAGIFYAPVSADLGIGTGLFGSYMTIQYLFMTFAMVFGGRILEVFDARIVLATCVAMIACSLMAMSQFNALWQFYISAAFIGSANSVLLYLMVPTMMDRWFVKRLGFVVGLSLCFTGIGAIILNPVGGYLIESFGWRMGYLTFGVIAAAIGLPSAILLIRSYPSDLGLKRFGEEGSPVVAADAHQSGMTVEAEVSRDAALIAEAEHPQDRPVAFELTGVPYKRAVRSAALYLVALYAGLMDVGITLNYYLPSYVGSLGYSVLVVSSVASAVMVGQLVGKILLGYLNDINVRIGVATAVGSGASGIAILTFLGGLGLGVLYVGAFLFGIFFAGATVTTSLVTRDIFGSRDFAKLFAIVAMVASFCAAFSSALWGALIDLTGSYEVTFCVGALLMLSTFLVAGLAFRCGHTLSEETRER